MPKLSPVRSRQLLSILLKEGFQKVRQRGSHLRLKHPDGRKTTVPMHTGEHIGKGLLRKILHDANISIEQFKKLR